MEFLKKHIHLILLLAATIAFVIFKTPHLSLPYYWDEAWVYGPAVRIMAENGLGLSPGALPVQYSRGHPLLFHFLAAAWLQVFGNTVLASHVFALVVSVALVFASYFVGTKLFDKRIALASTLLLLIQPIFLAQAGLVLPEVMLALFVVLSIYYILKGKMMAYFICATLMLFTKETGLAIVFVAFVIHLINEWKNLFEKPWQTIKSLFVVGSPVLVLVAFLVIQYFYHGWFFFPEHTDYVTFDIGTVLNRMTEGYGAYIFIYQGRNLLLFSALLLMVYAIIRKIPIKHKYELISLFAFIVGFMAVSSVNFFSNRYIMSIIPLFLFVMTGIILQVLKKNYLAIGFVFLAIGLQYPILTKKLSGNDHNLGYANAASTNLETANFLVSIQAQDKTICANFNTSVMLSRPLAGYVSEENKFRNIVFPSIEKADLVIVSNYDSPKDRWNIGNENNMKLLHRSEKGQAWMEVYQK